MSTALSSPAAAPVASAGLLDRYRQVRQFSHRLCQPLVTEDYGIQSMADVSPPKWHLAHVSWFFETFLLLPRLAGYEVFHPDYGYCFNSYYETVGDRHPRPQRGLLSRPTVADVYAYRAAVDEAMAQLLAQEAGDPELGALVELGLHHEQQHQELLVTDIKHILAMNPLRPAYRKDLVQAPLAQPGPLTYQTIPGGLVEMGHGGSGFAFDNEGPRHRVYLEDFALARRPITNGEYLDFVNDGGYRQPQHWLAEGWATVQAQGWQAPLYWEQRQGQWQIMTLGGLRDLNPAEPVCHVSAFEAEAFAHWAGQRLPTEAEWERASAGQALVGNFAGGDRFHPVPAQNGDRAGDRADHNGGLQNGGLQQLFGDVWEWTQSSYSPYPGYRAAAGAIGEYNGKFMCNQLVLRGGSCATPPGHIRPTYRNFFPASTRWQFSGIRLARLR